MHPSQPANCTQNGRVKRTQLDCGDKLATDSWGVLGLEREDAGLRLTYPLLMQCVTNLGSACRKGQWDSRFSYATVAKRGSEYAKHSDRVMDYRLDSVWHLLDQDELGCGAIGLLAKAISTLR